MFKSICTAALTTLTLCGIAQAGDHTPRLDQRQENQQQRIANGIESGQLNAREAAHLEHGEARLERHEAYAKSDGVVTGRERAALHAEANSMSRRIHRQKHDAQGRRRR
ncbi:MAG: hypothetical protein U1F11_16165 [Steroidobacteraceae bacterium]